LPAKRKHICEWTNELASLLQELGAMGYKFQFVTLAGFHSLNHSMFELASGYSKAGMAAYAELQQVCPVLAAGSQPFPRIRAACLCG
jgi:isocitrate lyase